MIIKKPFSPELLKISDIESFITRITEKLKNDVHVNIRKQGGVIGISGGIDSSVTLALCGTGSGNYAA
jgi:NAD+ synthase